MNTSISAAHASLLFETSAAGNSGSVATSKAKALELLGKGVKPSVVATILGVTPSLISQYQEDPEFKEHLKAKLIESQLAASVRDARLDALEDAIISRVEETISFFQKPADALGALKLVNGLTRRAPVTNVSPDDIATQTVSLQLPKHIQNLVVNIQVNTQNEVVEVNGREMRTMPTSQVLRELQVSQLADKDRLEKENDLRKPEASRRITGEIAEAEVISE